MRERKEQEGENKTWAKEEREDNEGVRSNGNEEQFAPGVLPTFSASLISPNTKVWNMQALSNETMILFSFFFCQKPSHPHNDWREKARGPMKRTVSGRQSSWRHIRNPIVLATVDLRRNSKL